MTRELACALSKVQHPCVLTGNAERLVSETRLKVPFGKSEEEAKRGKSYVRVVVSDLLYTQESRLASTIDPTRHLPIQRNRS